MRTIQPTDLQAGGVWGRPGGGSWHAGCSRREPPDDRGHAHVSCLEAGGSSAAVWCSLGNRSADHSAVPVGIRLNPAMQGPPGPRLDSPGTSPTLPHHKAVDATSHKGRPRHPACAGGRIGMLRRGGRSADRSRATSRRHRLCDDGPACQARAPAVAAARVWGPDPASGYGWGGGGEGACRRGAMGESQVALGAAVGGCSGPMLAPAGA